MKILKRIIIALIIAALVTGAVLGVGMRMRQANQKEVMVVSVGSVSSDYYYQNTNLEGQIATSVSQNVTVDTDMVIDEVYVSEGSTVKEGDPLVSFDMTLVEMELNIAKLKKTQQEQQLNQAATRLNNLENGGSISENMDLSGSLGTGSSGLDGSLDDDMAALGAMGTGGYLAAVMRPLLAASINDFTAGSAAEDGDEVIIPEADGGDTSDSEIITADPGVTEDPAEPAQTPDDSVVPTAAPESDPDETADDIVLPDGAQDDDTEFGSSEYLYYDVLDGTAEPFLGTGSADDPYVFLCNAVSGKVTVKGSFFNKMAGYSEDGSEVLHEGGYWFRLEFHRNNYVVDPENLQESCIGFYLIEGSLLEGPADPEAETELLLENAEGYVAEETETDTGYDTGTAETSLYTREEAIRIQQNMVTSLQLDIQESDIEISKLERKLERKMSYSKLSGTVSYVGDALEAVSTDGKTFITVKSEEGFYVQGTVGEMMLDQMKEGAVLNCTSYSSEVENFEAEVVDVSDYPVSGYTYYGDGNPNVSYYIFTAEIPDQSIRVSDQDWLNITMQNDLPADGSIVLDKAFVRTENGQSYVYKDENGTLKKQILTVGGNVNSGYGVLVKSGITLEDKIAFPYGENVKEGAKTTEVTVDQMYNS